MRALIITNKLESTKVCDRAIINIMVVWARLNFLDIAIVVAILVVPAVVAEQ